MKTGSLPKDSMSMSFCLATHDLIFLNKPIKQIILVFPSIILSCHQFKGSLLQVSCENLTIDILPVLTAKEGKNYVVSKNTHNIIIKD